MTIVYQPGPTEVGDTAITYAKDGFPRVEEIRVELRVIKGADPDVTTVIPREGIVVGSGVDAGFRIKDPSVSRKHVKLTPVPEGVQATDLGSTNGTVVDGKKIKEAVVQLDSALTLGKTTIEITKRVDREPLPISRRRKFGDLLGSAPAMRRVYALLERASDSDVTVLLEGATGTGKELAARALHRNSKRAARKFQIVDCGAVSPTLIEAELFGHVKGSFTGANRDRSGAFELAHEGTLFFDEIGELPLTLQPKLLRALETREVRRVGGSTHLPVDVRFVAATNRNIEEEVKVGRFREDLYYRLNVFKIRMPSLGEHREDIPLLVKHFLSTSGDATLSDEVMDSMTKMAWPGNVRELRNAVDRAIVMSGGGSKGFGGPRTEGDGGGGVIPELTVDANRPFKELKAEVVSRFEMAYLAQILTKTRGNISAAAREAGIDRKHMERLIRKHEIDVKSK